jgi:monoterpene epsilon-lactone hydrolase
MVATFFRLMMVVAWDLLRATMRRMFCGPAVLGWSWGVELRVVAFRSFLKDTGKGPELRRLVERRLDPPIPRRLRGLVRVERGEVGGVAGEWIVRSDFDDTTVLLYLHGGGYIGGSPATHRQLACRLTWAFGTRTFVPDYRLAPAHRFPAALDDSVAVYEHLGATDVVVAGDSAGGGLACALLLRLRDQGRPLPRGAVLFSPYTDLEHTAPSIWENAATDYLPLGTVSPNVAYLGDHDPRDPLASPMYGDFTGIPPLLIFAGGREMILDDARRLAAKAGEAGANVSLHVEPDMMHVWPAIVPEHPATTRALAVATEFVRQLGMAP